MTSNLLEKLGLSGLDIGLVLLILVVFVFILVVICIVLCVELCKLTKRYNRFSAGRDAKSMEKEIGSIFTENKALREQTDKNRRDIKHLYKRMETTIQKVGLVKYDAFSQMGGKLSFALCLLDEKDNGFVMNSVSGTDGNYTYSKEIKGGCCNLELGDEEKKALSMAMHEE